MSNSAGDGEPVGESVVDADAARSVDVSVYSRSSTRTILGGMPMEWIMCHRKSRSIESNAALRSMKAMKSARSFRNSRAFLESNRMAEM